MYENFLAEFNKAVLEAGRDIEEIELIGVSKKKLPEDIIKVFNQGHLSFGENQIQEIERKWPDLKKLNPNIQLHYIGNIQSRKVGSRNLRMLVENILYRLIQAMRHKNQA